MKNNLLTSWLPHRILRGTLAISFLFFCTIKPAFADISVQVWGSSNQPLIAPLLLPNGTQLQTAVEQALSNIAQKDDNAAVAKKPHSSDVVFWAGTRLFQAQSETAQLEKVLIKISALKQAKAKHAALVQSLNTLQTFLERSTFRTPLLNEIDLDNLRLGIIANPKIEQDAILLLPARLPFVWVVGALPRPIQFVHKSQASARD
ncbi:MAG: hypothetical protein ACRCWB_00495, partial [Enterovibrio sp.]